MNRFEFIDSRPDIKPRQIWAHRMDSSGKSDVMITRQMPDGNWNLNYIRWEKGGRTVLPADAIHRVWKLNE